MSFFDSKQSFGLPAGTVRGLLALVLVAAFIGTVYFEVASAEGEVALAAMASSAVTFYFTKRSNETE